MAPGGGVIVYASSFDVSRPDGPGVNEQQFIVSMARLLGEEVRFLIPAPASALPESFPVSLCNFLPILRGRSFIPWLRHQWSKLRTLRRIERELAPRLFVMRPDVFPVADVLFARRSLVPYCTKNAHLSAMDRLTTGGVKGVLLRMHYALLKRLFRGALVVDVVSEIQREDLIRRANLPADSVTVTDNAVDSRQFFPMDRLSCRTALGLKQFNPLFGYVGNVAAERGGTELIRSLPELLVRFPEAGALIVEGDGKSAQQLGRVAEALGVRERVVFVGPIPLAAVPGHIAAMDVAVSFRDDDGCAELKVRQYIACGRPVVASARVNEFVDTEGLGSLVARDDIAAISRALKHWADESMDPARAARLAERLGTYARQHLDADAANKVRITRWLNALASRAE